MRQDTGSPELYALAIERADSGIAILDSNTRIVTWNRWLRDHSGVGDEAVGRRFFDVMFDTSAWLAGAVHDALTNRQYANLSSLRYPAPLPLFKPAPRGCGASRIPHSISVVPLVTGNAAHCMIFVNAISGQATCDATMFRDAGALNASVYIDELTGLRTRKKLDEYLDSEMRRASRSGSPLSLFLIDIDSLQSYNESCGRAAGDECLRLVAQALMTCLRRHLDLLARYEGDRLAAILPDTGAERARIVCKAMLEAVRALQISHTALGDELVLSASIGFSSTGNDGAISPVALMDQADVALCLAKAAGKGHARAFDPLNQPVGDA